MTDEPVGAGHLEARIWWHYVLGIGVGVGVFVLLFLRRGDLASALDQLRGANRTWLAASVLVEFSSFLLFSELQHHVLRLAGTPIRRRSLLAVTFANNAISNTVPGEPAVSSAYRYRFYRHRGASSATAGWAIFTALISLSIGMAVLVLFGVLVALLASSSDAAAGAAMLAIFIVIGSLFLLVRRDLLLRGGHRLVGFLSTHLGHPRPELARRIEGALARMADIPLSAGGLLSAAILGLAVWGASFGCLLCSFKAVGATIPWSGVLLAFGVAQVIGSIPIVPGGIGIVEGSLSVVLVAYGTSRSSALAVALTYRLVNFWLFVLVGWVAVALLAALRARRRTPEAAEVPR